MIELIISVGIIDFYFKSSKVWEVATKQCLHTFTDHSDQVSAHCLFSSHIGDVLQVWSVKYNKEGNQVVSVSDDKSVNIYSIPV